MTTIPPIERYALEHADALILIEAPDGREAETAAGLIARRHLLRQSTRPVMERLGNATLRAIYGLFPTPALAQDADMSLQSFEDVLYAACLQDWEREADRMRGIAACLDGATSVHLLGEDTDLRLSLAGQRGEVDDGRMGLPGGRISWHPVAGSADGVITFHEYPAVYRGQVVEGARLEFLDGRIVRATACRGEDVLLETLGAGTEPWSLRGFGLDCNPAIRRYTGIGHLDERMDGSVHLVLGGSCPSHAPWTLIKDFKAAGCIICDERAVYANGAWIS